MMAEYKSGEVVFNKELGEYEKIVRVFRSAILTFNPRWGGKDIYAPKSLRKLTAKEKGDKR